METKCKNNSRGRIDYEDYLNKKFDLSKEEDILKVLSLSDFIPTDNVLQIKYVDTKQYHNVTKLKSYTTEDSIYTDGRIVGSEFGKAIVDFSIALIFKKEFHTERLINMYIIINGSSDEECHNIMRSKLAYYLNPLTFSLLLY